MPLNTPLSTSSTLASDRSSVSSLVLDPVSQGRNPAAVPAADRSSVSSVSSLLAQTRVELAERIIRLTGAVESKSVAELAALPAEQLWERFYAAAESEHFDEFGH